MAKKATSYTYRNCTVCLADKTITEITKDETKVFSLDKFLHDIDGIEGISLSAKVDEDMPEDGE